MLFENGFLNWLCRKINVRKPRLEACIHRYKIHETNQPRRQLPTETSIYNFWLEDESSVVSTDCRSGRKDVRISKFRYLAEFNHLQGIIDVNIREEEVTLSKTGDKKSTANRQV